MSSARRSRKIIACRRWVNDLLNAGRRVILPEAADYELRRELLRIDSTNGLDNLDQMASKLEYLPLTTLVMRQAAKLWAEARKAGKPTAPMEALDCDAIIASQALSLNAPVIVATENPGHISRFVPADSWTNIRP